MDLSNLQEGCELSQSMVVFIWNYSQGNGLPSQKAAATPSGWLINQEKELVLIFIRDPMSLMSMPKVITQRWHSTQDGVPITVKNKRTMDLESAIEAWNE